MEAVVSTCGDLNIDDVRFEETPDCAGDVIDPTHDLEPGHVWQRPSSDTQILSRESAGNRSLALQSEGCSLSAMNRVMRKPDDSNANAIRFRYAHASGGPFLYTSAASWVLEQTGIAGQGTVEELPPSTFTDAYQCLPAGRLPFLFELVLSPTATCSAMTTWPDRLGIDDLEFAFEPNCL